MVAVNSYELAATSVTSVLLLPQHASAHRPASMPPIATASSASGIITSTPPMTYASSLPLARPIVDAFGGDSDSSSGDEDDSDVEIVSFVTTPAHMRRQAENSVNAARGGAHGGMNMMDVDDEAAEGVETGESVHRARPAASAHGGVAPKTSFYHSSSLSSVAAFHAPGTNQYVSPLALPTKQQPKKLNKKSSANATAAASSSSTAAAAKARSRSASMPPASDAAASSSSFLLLRRAYTSRHLIPHC